MWQLRVKPEKILSEAKALAGTLIVPTILCGRKKKKAALTPGLLSKRVFGWPLASIQLLPVH